MNGQEFRRGQVVQGLNQIRGLGKVVAFDIEHGYFVRDNISDDAVTGLGNDHIRRAHQVAILRLHFGQHGYIALTLTFLVGADEIIIS